MATTIVPGSYKIYNFRFRKYVTVDSTNSELYDDASSEAAAEVFQIAEATREDGTIGFSLQANNGSFVRISQAGGFNLIADGPAPPTARSIFDIESFTEDGEEYFLIYSEYTEGYVSPDTSRRNGLFATTADPKTWERFTFK